MCKCAKETREQQLKSASLSHLIVSQGSAQKEKEKKNSEFEGKLPPREKKNKKNNLIKVKGKDAAQRCKGKTMTEQKEKK